jgi:hypothetical protein
MGRLSKAESWFSADMLRLLEYGARHPTQWHNLRPDMTETQAAKILAERGVIEIRPQGNQFRLLRAERSTESGTS